MRLPAILLAAACAAASAHAAVKVSCIGNSITASRYPSFLQWDLGVGVTVQNAGVPTTTLLYAGEAPWIATLMIDTVAMFRPDYAYIKLGTNDSKAVNWDTHGSEFVADCGRLIDTVRSRCAGVRVRQCLPTPAWTNSGGIRGAVIESSVIPAIRQGAQSRSVPIVDLHTPFLADSLLFPDGFHPSDQGALKIAQQVAAAVRGEIGVAPNLAAGATAQASGYVSALLVPANVLDSDPFTAWASNNAGVKWLQVDLGQARRVDSWEVVHAWEQQASRTTRDFKLQTSDNGTIWRDIDSVAGNTAPWTGRSITAVTARWFRLYITYPSVDNIARVNGFALRNQASTPVAAPVAAPAVRAASGRAAARPAGSVVFDVSGRAVGRAAAALLLLEPDGPGLRLRAVAP